jgi:YggT family protein
VFLVSLIATLVYYALLLYFFILWARFILDLVQSVNRGWRPHGGGMVAATAVYTLTDPPVRFFRRIMPPLSIGPIAFDFGWSLTILCVIVGMWITAFFR